VDDEVVEEALDGTFPGERAASAAAARAEAAEAEVGAEEREAAAAGGGDVVAHLLHFVLRLLLRLRLRAALGHPPLRPQRPLPHYRSRSLITNGLQRLR